MIYVNGRFLTRPMTGVERYAYHICKAMAELQLPFTIICPISGSNASCRFSLSARKTM